MPYAPTKIPKWFDICHFERSEKSFFSGALRHRKDLSLRQTCKNVRYSLNVMLSQSEAFPALYKKQILRRGLRMTFSHSLSLDMTK